MFLFMCQQDHHNLGFKFGQIVRFLFKHLVMKSVCKFKFHLIFFLKNIEKELFQQEPIA